MRRTLPLLRALGALLLGIALPAAPPAAQVAPPDAFPDLPAFSEPMDAAAAVDGSNRLYVAERGGPIYAFVAEPTASERALFLDLTGRVAGTPPDGGVQSLAFPPDFATRRYVVVHYVTVQGGTRTIVSRFDVTDAGVADPASEAVLLDVPRVEPYHNGGKILFGPDGYLYVPLGDGGFGASPLNGQDRTVLLGKVLRLDVDDPPAGQPYGIPPDNPYVGNASGWREEIWAYGVRNPWRSSFDAEGRLWVGDVGDVTWEEVNRVEAAGNYGWDTWEGFACHTSPCEALPDLVFPVHAYPHDDEAGGYSITGGYVYRGSRSAALVGRYVFADLITDRVWTLDPDAPQNPDVRLLGTLPDDPWVAAFGEDEAGELYAVSYARGRLYDVGVWASLVAAEPAPTAAPVALHLRVSPNPFRHRAMVEVAHPAGGGTRVTVVDALGRVVALLFDGSLGPGQPLRLPLDGSALAAGVYVVRLEAGGALTTQRLTRVP